MPGLTYQTFVSPPIPIAIDDLVPNGDRRMMSPLATTLISGEREAVLVDPPMTSGQAAAVGDWVASAGRELKVIYVTHGHGDHWFGSGPLLARFPHAVVYAMPGTIEQMRFHASAQMRAAWEAQFPGQLSQTDVTATAPDDGRFGIEGHELRAVEVGHTDTDATTVLHVPGIDLVVAGDVVYNNVHQYLREAQGDGIDQWLAALAQVESLAPSAVVSGHKDASRPDDPGTIDETRQYLLDARELIPAHPGDALGFFQAMLKRYPTRLNPGALWSGALSLFSA